MTTAILCTARSPFEIESLINRLTVVVASATDISLLMADRPGGVASAFASRVIRRPGSRMGRQAGGIAGGIFGALAGAGILTIPGLGLFIAAGPIIAAISGVAVGAAMGGITGALVGMGLPESEARSYEDKVRAGSALLTVRTHRASELDRVRRVLEHAQAEDIRVVGATGDPAA